MEPSDEIEFSDILTSLAQLLLTSESAKADLERLAETTCRLIKSCSGASVSMMIDGQPTSVAVTDRVTLELDLVQYEHDDGPCIVALGGDQVRIGFVPEDERFPHFASGAADRRVLSVLSTPAMDHGVVVGSLNIYSHQPDAFDDVAQDIGLVMAAEVAHALVRSHVLGVARTSRDALQARYDESTLLARAQGVLVGMQDCSVAQAGDLIRNAAAQNHERLIHTAERILNSIRHAEDLSDAPDHSDH